MTQGIMQIQKYRGLTLTTFGKKDVVYHVVSKRMDVMASFRFVDEHTGRYIVTCEDGIYMSFADRLLYLRSDHLDPVNMEYIFFKETFKDHFSWILRSVLEYIIKEESGYGHDKLC